MGIQDRDYYREDGGGFLAQWARYGQVTKTLIAVNIGVFVIQLIALPDRGWLASHGVLIGDRVLHGEVWRLLTYGFLHDPHELLHIIFNMLFLYIFGREMEDRHGPREFLAFYLVSIVIAGLLYLGSTAIGLNKTDLSTRCLGASGGVIAVLVLYAFHFPMRQVLLLGLIPMPVWLLVAIYVGLNLLGILGGSNEITGENVAFAAHLGGAAFGAAYYWWEWRLTAWLPRLPTRLGRPRSRPSLRVYDDEPSRAAPTPAEERPRSQPSEEQLETQVDAVLAKVAKQGQGSLTTAERAILQRAGEVYRRRRK